MSLKIALVYNGIRREMLLQEPLDRTAELDSAQTIETLRQALVIHGHEVCLIEADDEAYVRIRASGVDLVFNIAEGVQGADREAQIPAMLEMLGIPYTGSGPLALALCLHKGKAKEVLSWHRIPTPSFQVVSCLETFSPTSLAFPLIVKLLHEGSSMGLSYDSVVEAPEALAAQIALLTRTYAQPVIVEQFIDGQEFTVAILGNTPPRALPVIEVMFDGPRRLTLFQPDDTVIRDVARAAGLRLVDPPDYALSADKTRVYLRTDIDTPLSVPVSLTRSVCPADISPALTADLQETAVRAFQALECRDWGRVDMRVGMDGIPQVLEVNPIAGIDPSYWFPRSARAAGLEYADLIQAIVEAAQQRYGL